MQHTPDADEHWEQAGGALWEHWDDASGEGGGGGEGQGEGEEAEAPGGEAGGTEDPPGGEGQEGPGAGAGRPQEEGRSKGSFNKDSFWTIVKIPGVFFSKPFSCIHYDCRMVVVDWLLS